MRFVWCGYYLCQSFCYNSLIWLAKETGKRSNIACVRAPQYDRDGAIQSKEQVNVFVIDSACIPCLYFAQASEQSFVCVFCSLFWILLLLLLITDRKCSAYLIVSHRIARLGQYFSKILCHRMHATCAHVYVYVWLVGGCLPACLLACIQFKQGFIVCQNVIFKIEMHQCCKLMHIADAFCTRHYELKSFRNDDESNISAIRIFFFVLFCFHLLNAVWFHFDLSLYIIIFMCSKQCCKWWWG